MTLLMFLGAKITLITLLALAVGWTFVLLRARTQEASAEQLFPPEGQIIRVEGVDIHAVVIGSGPDLVLIHGSSGNTRDMTFELAGELADRYRVIVFDRPGLGYSGIPGDGGTSITDQARLLHLAAQDLGARRPIVMGHSYGGAVALAWAVNHPDHIASLVLLSAASMPWPDGLSTYYRITSHPILGPITVPLITALAGPGRVQRAVEKTFTPQSVPRGYADHFGPALTLRRASLRENARQRANLLDEVTALSVHYAAITTPTEILHGTADTLVRPGLHAEQLVTIIPNATLTLIKGAGHMPHHTHSDHVIAAIYRASGHGAQAQ